MKAKMKKLIDVDELLNQLNISDVPYCAKINNIIANMPKVSMYEIKAEDYPANGNSDFEITINEAPYEAPYDVPCNCESDDIEEVPAYVSRMINEYHELKDKYTKLHRMLVKYEAGTLDFEPTCPLRLLDVQEVQ